MDEKMKKQKVDVSTLLSIDSPMVIWFTDLEGAGIGGGAGTGSGESGGGTGTGGGESSGGGAPVEPAIMYAALCDEQHSSDEPSVDANGQWSSPIVGTFEEARGFAVGHGHAAYVTIVAGGVVIGPVVQH